MRRQSLLAGRALPILLAGSLVFSAHLLWAQKLPETLPEAPRSQTASRGELFRIRYHYALIDTQAALNLRQSRRTAELPGEYFPSTASSQGLMAASGNVHHPTIQPMALLQYYGRHVPGAVPAILRVSEQAKAHPHVTDVLKLFSPQF